ncbi:MAG: monovalent cation/H+ antiporter subunit D family protein [Opitutales bacterium]
MSWEHVIAGIPLSFFFGALIISLLNRRSVHAPHGVALVATLVALVSSIVGLVYSLMEGTTSYEMGGWPAPMGIEFILDPLSAFFCVVISATAVFVFIHGKSIVEKETPGKLIPFYSTAMLLLGGLMGIVLTGDFFNLYVFLEISSLAGYALVSLGDRRAPVSAFRYLILGTIGASFYLLGAGLLFMETGSLNMGDVHRVLPVIGESPATLVGIILIILGIGLKMALFPLHGWLADAYTHASSVATALIAPIGTKVAAYFLLRMFFYVLEIDYVRDERPLALVVGYLGAAGIVWGSIMAISQKDLKRMLAYSSVAQVGYLALGIGLTSPFGFIGAVLHTLNHAFMKACLFLVNTNILSRMGHTSIPRFDHTYRIRMPWTMATLAVASLSMIGLPPTAGFFSKWYLVLGTLEQGSWILLAVILLSTLLNAVYFFRILERVYLRSDGAAYDEKDVAREASIQRDEVQGSMLAPTVILGVSLIVLGLGNVFIVKIIQAMIPAGLL